MFTSIGLTVPIGHDAELFLYRLPNNTWEIRGYEFGTSKFFGFARYVGMPVDWREKQFDSSESAIRFVKRQVARKKIPSGCVITPLHFHFPRFANGRPAARNGKGPE
jgi:hypothetical protein